MNLTRISLSLLLVAVPFATHSSTAAAQRPALVKSVDEPGRAPYVSHRTPDPTHNCFASSCVVQFDTVPAGFRLVVTYASAQITLTKNGTGAYFALGADGNFLGSRILLPAPVNIGADTHVAGGAVTFYVEPGSAPTIFMFGNNVDVTGQYFEEAAITGYLVAIP